MVFNSTEFPLQFFPVGLQAQTAKPGTKIQFHVTAGAGHL